MRRLKILQLLPLLFFAALLALTGCTDGEPGEDAVDGLPGTPGEPGPGGEEGPPGEAGPPGTDGRDGRDLVGALPLDIVVSSFSISNVGGKPLITFTLEDEEGYVVTDVTSEEVQFFMAELTPVVHNIYNGITALGFWTRWLYERSSDDDTEPFGTLTESTPGSYTYAFATPFSGTGEADSYVPNVNRIQRLSMIVSGISDYQPLNMIYDFKIAEPTIELTERYALPQIYDPVRDRWLDDPLLVKGRNIVTTDGCNECHDDLAMHGGIYRDVRTCSNCHTISDPDRVASGTDFRTLIHQLHSAMDGTALYGLNDEGMVLGYDFSATTYPQNMFNCAKCHQGVDGDAWFKEVSRVGCDSCHTAINWVTGANHSGGRQSTDGACFLCHGSGSASSKAVHVTSETTEHNPSVIGNSVNFSYQLNRVTVNGSNQAVVDFTILKNEHPNDVTSIALALDLSGPYPPEGFTGGPSFLLAYALPQEGIEAPADFNNLGRVGGAALSVPLADVVGSLTAGASEGSYVVTLTTAPFPAGATLRTVALQGAFTQSAVRNEAGATFPLSRPTPAVLMTVEGDEPRRMIADVNGCLSCHETLEFHDRNSMNNVQVCVMCHNPNLSSSGRTIDPLADIAPEVTAAVGADPLSYPETSVNFKDLIHGLHAGDKRLTDYHLVSNQTSAGLTGVYSSWQNMTFPGNLANCQKCHLEGTFELSESVDLLASTQVTTDGINATTADVLAARATLPNATDKVISSAAAACIACHDSALARAHIRQNGARVNADRSTLGEDIETCALCHGAERIADVVTAHAQP